MRQETIVAKHFYLALVLVIFPVSLASQTTGQQSQNPYDPFALSAPQTPNTTGTLPGTPTDVTGRPVVNPNLPITNVNPTLELTQQQRELEKEKEEQTRGLVEAPPEPDLEFQRLVAASVGRPLPIFGQNLFQKVPTTFAPLQHVEVTPDYLIGPGDEIIIKIWGQLDYNWRAVVDRSGAVYIPKVGSVDVTGVRYADLHDHLQKEIGKYFKNFQLSVSLGQLRSMQVYLVGQVKRPGAYSISALSTLVDALFATGGPSKKGSLRNIQVKRNGQMVTTFDLYDLLVNGDKSRDAKLENGDVIYVPPVGPLVAVDGSVHSDAIFELRDNNTLADVIRFAGGLTTTAAPETAMLERIDDRHIREAHSLRLDVRGLELTMKDGDVLRFPHMTSQFENSVTLRGNIALPGHYPWHPGMRVHDLIPSREFLVTEEYWQGQNALANPGQPPIALQNQPGTPSSHVGEQQLKNDVKHVGSEINWQYAVVQRFDLQDLSTHLLPFNLAKALTGDETQNLELQQGDIVTIFSQGDIQVPLQEQTKFVHLEGEFVQAGVYQVESGETLRHLIERIGGFTPQAYLYGSEFTRESTRVDQQQRLDEYVTALEQSIERTSAAIASAGDPTEIALARSRAENQRALANRMRGLKATGRIVLEIKPDAGSSSAIPDLTLEDGDRFVVPFRPATVNVIGSVYNSNSFIYKRGKTVGDYMRLAGGPTRDGDRARAFVIRADGSTVSRQQHNRLISYGFESLRLMPGDTVVVPEKLDRGAFLRGLRDYTQIFTQFVLGAAAAKVLFP